MMERRLIYLAVLAAATASLAHAQQQTAPQPSQYEGVSNPPQDAIISDENNASGGNAPILLPNAQRTPKPPAGTPLVSTPDATVAAQPAAIQTPQTPMQPAVAPAMAAQPVVPQPAQQPAYAEPIPSQVMPVNAPANAAVDNDPDDGIVHPTAPPPSYPVQQPAPALATRQAIYNGPDGDMVHPGQGVSGEIAEGTTIRVELLERLSTAYVHPGDHFRTRVAVDVLSNGQVIIPAGSEITGLVASATEGEHLGGHGQMRLRPESVLLPNGMRYAIRAQTTGTPGSRVRIGAEGTINPGSQTKKDSIEYGATAGTGAIVGAALGGPVGALAGAAVGTGIVTTHILVNHPQATLEPGSVLLFTLTEPLYMTAAAANGAQ